MTGCRCNERLPLTDMRDINGWVESVVLRREAGTFYIEVYKEIPVKVIP